MRKQAAPKQMVKAKEYVSTPHVTNHFSGHNITSSTTPHTTFRRRIQSA